MRTKELTETEQKTLGFIQTYIKHHQHSPKINEIAQGIGIRSRGVAHRYVQALERAGFVTVKTGKHRGIRLKQTPTNQAKKRLPLLGKIAAGKPIEAIAGEDEINLQNFFGKANFALRVQGDSMIDIGLMAGDTAIIKFSETANNGDIVVALIDEEEVTLKQFKRSKDGQYIKLMPANKEMKAMIYKAARIRIQGILIGQLRRY